MTAILLELAASIAGLAGITYLARTMANPTEALGRRQDDRRPRASLHSGGRHE